MGQEDAEAKREEEDKQMNLNRGKQDKRSLAEVFNMENTPVKP